jgi:hypothetical protein
MPEPHLRASDNDRALVATALGEHMAAGRLTLAEYEDRLTQVYATKTIGGLATLTADLPPTAPARPPTPSPAATGQRTPARVHACAPAPWGAVGAGHSSWRSWLTTALIVLGVWTVTSIATGAFLYFWPIWVIGPWGAVLVAQTLTGGRDGDPRHDRDEKRRIRA